MKKIFVREVQYHTHNGRKVNDFKISMEEDIISGEVEEKLKKAMNPSPV